MTERAINFSAGPAVLPEPVIRKAQDALWSLGDSGIGIMEHSHRGPEYDAVQAEAEAAIRKLAGISDRFAVLFLQGGASQQFFQLPMNFLGKDQTADFLNTGTWSKKAIAEAKRYGTVHVASSSADRNFAYIPKTESYSQAPVYVHYTSNNTIAGTQFHRTPQPPSGVPLYCDASSDIFSRPIDVERHHVIYAGAQKNLGPSGLTLVIIDKALAASGNQDIPTLLRYQTHIENDSRYNTPPTFAIYVLGEVAKWLLEQGGLPAIAEHNQAKAGRLYDFLDDSAMFASTVDRDSRSLMNVTFRAKTPELDAEFLSVAKSKGLSGLKGHRSVGGMRASIYNAFPQKGVERLVEVMKDFEASH